MMDYDVIIVGGGVAGLTSAAYAVKAGLSTLVLEQQAVVGGLVNSFERNGFVFDQGIRSIESSGIVFPMLKQLGIELEFVRNVVSLGVADSIIRIESTEALADYERLLGTLFPEETEHIALIVAEIKKIMAYMDVLYGIDNPLFLQDYKDTDYIVHTLLPWLFKYLTSMPKVAKLNEPVHRYLKKFTDNQALIDIIAQHFFKDTPTYFALSYFSLYLDYNYPIGGTGAFSRALADYITSRQGIIKVNTAVDHIDTEHHRIIDRDGSEYSYGQLIWAADFKSFYKRIDEKTIFKSALKKKVMEIRETIQDAHGGDSIFTLYLSVNLPVHRFSKITSAHLFYTPRTPGLSHIPYDNLQQVIDGKSTLSKEGQKQLVFAWIDQYFTYTTYEISFPAMRDPTLAPKGKTGMIVSSLFDYPIVRFIDDQGWYDEFKKFGEQTILKILSDTLFPTLSDHVIDCVASTPLTIERITSNTEGAITGWAFTNPTIPVVHEMKGMAKSVETPFKDIQQAGQWVFSPSGLPISVITGKMAAERAMKRLKKR